MNSMQQICDRKEAKLDDRRQKILSLKLGLKKKIEEVKNNKQSTSLGLNITENSEYDGSTSEIMSKSNEKSTQQPKQSFDDKYEIKQLLGHGRNGSVYKCEHKDLKKQYAVKKIKYEREHIIFLKESFYQVMKLNQASIIRYKSIYFQSKRRLCFLVMQLFPHQDLTKYQIKNQKQLKNIIYKLLEAVKYLHQKGICHRDIKPQNILYDPVSQQIKLIDFGVSKKFRIRKFIKELMTPTGTELYKAPQMITGGLYNELIDEWAIGITIYQLITGVTPFQSSYISEVNQKIKQGVVVFDETIWRQYGQAKDLVENLLKPHKQRITAAQAQKHLWFEKVSATLSSSIKIPLKKTFSIEQTIGQGHLLMSQKVNNDSLVESIQLQNKKYIKQSFLNSLPLVGESWCYSQEEDDEQTV